MHKLNCQCPKCNPGASPFQMMDFRPRQAEAFEGEGEYESSYEGEGEGEGEYEGESQYEGPGE